MNKVDLRLKAGDENKKQEEKFEDCGSVTAENTGRMIGTKFFVDLNQF